MMMLMRVTMTRIARVVLGLGLGRWGCRFWGVVWGLLLLWLAVEAEEEEEAAAGRGSGPVNQLPGVEEEEEEEGPGSGPESQLEEAAAEEEVVVEAVEAAG